MQEKNLELYEFAKRVNKFSPKRHLSYDDSKNNFKGMKLPSMNFSLTKKKSVAAVAPPMKNPKKMNMDEFDTKRVSFVRAAYVAYKCCQNQNLHLFQLEKIYQEKKFVLKGVVGWKLPKKKFLQHQLWSLVEGLKFNSGGYKNHLVTWIANLKKAEGEKSLQDHLELQKQGKEKRNYSLTKSVF